LRSIKYWEEHGFDFDGDDFLFSGVVDLMTSQVSHHNGMD